MRLFAACDRHGPDDTSAPRSLGSAARTHIGLIRSVNEDRLLDRPDVGLWAVVDGMGGHDGGDVAATITVRALERCANGAPVTMARIETALAGANDEIRRRRGGGVSGCTVAGLIAADDGFTVFWAGDSRVYRWRDGALETLTHDHSVVQELVDAKLLSADQAARHPNANVITRALGVGEKVEVDTSQGPIATGDRFLLCTDGLWGMVRSSVIAAQMALAPEAAVAGLTTAALDAGGRDNIAAIVVA